ncbi:MAG: hypothetical protein BWX80_03665 [Candidatus Hydrogenedentes bacterium ADurb.Bin101]|nr:MAG: hypothetical protein BWX80_03665 [Candidatus Hydrogenedentes bacterium ADurb.Bin101]
MRTAPQTQIAGNQGSLFMTVLSLLPLTGKITQADTGLRQRPYQTLLQQGIRMSGSVLELANTREQMSGIVKPAMEGTCRRRASFRQGIHASVRTGSGFNPFHDGIVHAAGFQKGVFQLMHAPLAATPIGSKAFLVGFHRLQPHFKRGAGVTGQVFLPPGKSPQHRNLFSVPRKKGPLIRSKPQELNFVIE